MFTVQEHWEVVSLLLIAQSSAYFLTHFTVKQKIHFIESLTLYNPQKLRIKLFLTDQGTHLHPYIKLIDNCK